MNTEDLRHYYVSRKTMLKTARYRGCEVDQGLIDLSLEDFESQYSNSSLTELKKGLAMEFGKGENTLAIRWHLEPKLGPNISEITKELKEKGIKKALVVVDEATTAMGRDIMRNLRTVEKVFIDVWTLEEAQLFVPEHVLVPPHRICSVSEKKRLFTSYGVSTKEDIPWIRYDDVMVKYLGASRGQLIEIRRPNECDEDLTIESYRVVV